MSDRLQFSGDDETEQGFTVDFADGGLAGAAYYDCERSPASMREAERLARLFAASPDLLAACRAVVEYAERTANCFICTGADGHEENCPVPSAQAAIAKAEGGAAKS